MCSSEEQPNEKSQQDLLKCVSEDKGWTVMQNKRISTTEGEVGFPDLIMVKGTRALVLDVAIRLEVSSSPH